MDHGRQRVNNTRRCNTVMKTLAVFHPIGLQRNTMLIIIIIIIIIIFNEGTQFATAVFSRGPHTSSSETVSPWQQPKVAKGELHSDDRL